MQALFTAAFSESNVSLIVLVTGIIFIAWAVKTHLKVNDLEPLRKNASRVIESLDKIDAIHHVIITRFGKDMFEANSPVSLNKYGKSLAEKMDADALVDKYAHCVDGNRELGTIDRCASLWWANASSDGS